eukprot:CAMPEP_0113844326 /NCGR_PEP_ID=MMETSP0372-20130328/182_1 /TAXON_ID=340204 /ORGANISM="Lankesteria abbotti" /LENGTH=240 /DNA_ID=CAMNT_0000813331 /DNA_START=357 /DNA_END=1076 /DNA_ORIENTATION=+ /assembly_acc=CAM_ASM_000359
MNKVWPYNNPMETYSYYTKLPVCHPGHVESLPMTFGQIMRGDRLVNSLYEIRFLEPIDTPRSVCSKAVTSEDLDVFRKSIDQNYMFEIYIADLPINKPLGVTRVDESGNLRYYLVTEMDFELGFNEDDVVAANMTVDRQLTDITTWREGFTLEFVYSVEWHHSDISTHAKLHKQLAGVLTPSTHTLDIHWLAIINSFVLVLFIVSLLLLIILRVVRSDLSKYLKIPDEEFAAGVEEESGW